MPRQSRLVIPGVPHHVTQRGNRRLPVFFNEGDYRAYKELLARWCARTGTEIWAYCLMPNHVHLILTPSHSDGLRAALGETHRRYTSHVNEREGWRGHLWQSRFASFAMDENYLLACARYIELNPVRAGLVRKAGDWAWSSAQAHLSGKDDGLVKVVPLLQLVDGWRDMLDIGPEAETFDRLRTHQRTGYPLGGEGFLQQLKIRFGRDMAPRIPGRPKKIRDSI